MNLRSSDKVFGWTGKILDVNLTTGSMRTRDTLAYVPDYIGGRAMASRIAWDEIPPGTRAYAPENRVSNRSGGLPGGF